MSLKKKKNLHKKKIIFITDNIFNLRDYERYGINFLNKKLDVKIFSLNKDCLKKKNIFFFKNFYKFKTRLLFEKPAFIIDLMFPSYQSYLIKNNLKKNGTKLIKLKLGTYPLKHKSFIERLLNIFNKNHRLGGNIFVKLRNNFFNKLNSFISYDYFFIDSKLHFNENENKKTIKGHSLDYDFFLKNKKKTKRQKIVFLDSNVVGHSDYSIHSTKTPVNKHVVPLVLQFSWF